MEGLKSGKIRKDRKKVKTHMFKVPKLKVVCLMGKKKRPTSTPEWLNHAFTHH